MDEYQVAHTNPNIVKGSILALIAFFFMAVFGIFTKLALAYSSFVFVSFIAYLTASIVLLPYILYKGIDYLRSDHYGLLFTRAFFGTLASFCYTISIIYIPIVNGTLLFNTAPIFIPILIVLFLKAPVAKRVWVAVIIGFIGIITIIHPTMAIFSDTGNLVAIASGLFLAIAYLSMKLLTNTDPGIRIIFYYLALGTLLQLPLLFLTEWHFDFPSLYYAILSGITLVIAQIALVTSYKYAKASEVGIYQYSTIVFVGLLNWLIWREVPAPIDLIGVILVAIAGMIIIHSNSHSLPKKSNESKK